jgi:large subunit ribosomal protein L6e
MAKNKNVGKPRNYALETGVYRFGKSKTYHKKAVYKFVKKTTPKKSGSAGPAFIEKRVGGAKNGETRMVRVKRLRNDYPTIDKKPKGSPKNVFAAHARKLRPSLSPGVVVIVLAGAHKGKRVVVLKQLQTGLLLVTGPFKVNGCPLRRINARYVIATKTIVDMAAVQVPDKLNDDYFRRVKTAKKGKGKKDGDIFEAKKEEYAPSEERKTDQAAVDAQVLEAIKKHPEAAELKAYLKHSFGLSKGQYPHKMVF